jgi:hypothetical protein
MSINKHVAILSASPKPSGDSASGILAKFARDILRDDSLDIHIINVRESVTKKQTAEAFDCMAAADALIVIFPLYIFCLPGVLMRFLQTYQEYAASLAVGAKKAAVYAVVNCGFPEPEINGEAVRVIASFSEKIGAEFHFGVLIGGGGMITGAQNAPPVKKMMADVGTAFERMKREIAGGGRESGGNVLTQAYIPRKFYYFMGNIGWRIQARKNGLKRKEIFAKPYQL